jgi:transmembrane sensor
VENHQLKEKFNKYLNNQCSAEEVNLLLNRFGTNDDVYLCQLISTELESLDDVAEEQSLMLLSEEVLGNIRKHLKPVAVQTISLWPKLIGITASVAIIAYCIYFFGFDRKLNFGNSTTVSSIIPGRNGATLTLANGHKILLSDAVNGELASESGVIISKNSNGQLIYELKSVETNGSKSINTLSTTNGETYQVILPDHTQVWLNSGSSLSYPASFTGSAERKVKLTGEAYFEVAKDKKRPFRVATAQQEVEVLGTHFNINSYSDEPVVRTTLLEGSIKIKQYSFDHTVTLKPNQQSILRHGAFKIEIADVAEAVAWKNGNFVFNGETIQSIMRKLARWYNIEVDYEGKITEEVFYADISRNKNITEVLKVLQQAEGVHFKIEERRVTVIP